MSVRRRKKFLLDCSTSPRRSGEIAVTEKDLEEAGLYQEIPGMSKSDLEGRRFVESWGGEAAAMQNGELRALVSGSRSACPYKTRFLPR